MQLLVVRHGIAAERGQPPWDEDDDARPLTRKGVERTRAACRGLARLLEAPDVIYSSPLLRAAQTAALLAEAFSVRPRPEPLAALAPGHGPAALARRLAGKERAALVALVGHEPDGSELLAWLTAGEVGMRVELRKGGAALVAIEPPLGPGRGTLLWLATPRLLRAAGRR